MASLPGMKHSTLADTLAIVAKLNEVLTPNGDGTWIYAKPWNDEEVRRTIVPHMMSTACIKRVRDSQFGPIHRKPRAPLSPLDADFPLNVLPAMRADIAAVKADHVNLIETVSSLLKQVEALKSTVKNLQAAEERRGLFNVPPFAQL